MAQTLDEFLISVRYAVDEPSQTKFFDALKRAATSIAGIAGQMVGLGVAVLGLSSKMADAGSKLYWLSQRTGESVSNIEAMSYALEGMGISGQQAVAALDKLANWSNSRGPSAQNYLRSLGITATDTGEQLAQMGQRLMRYRQGTIEYAIELNRFSAMGFSEADLRAFGDPRYEAGLREKKEVNRQVWGADFPGGPEKFAKMATDVSSQFAKMGLIFSDLTERFALGLFKVVLPELEKINTLLISMLPQIEGFLDNMVAAAPAVLQFLEGAIKGFGFMLKLGVDLIKDFRDLPAVVQHAIEAFVLLPKALDLMRSPLFLMLTGLTTLLLLLEDYKYWQKDQETHSKTKHSYFDWSKPHAMFGAIGDNPIVKYLTDANDKAAKWFDNMIGICGAFKTIEVTLGLIVAKWGLGKYVAGPLRSLLFGGAATAAEGAAGAAAGGIAAPLILTAIATAIGTAIMDAIYEWLKSKGWVHDFPVDPKTGKMELAHPWWMPSGNPDEDEAMPDWAKRMQEIFRQGGLVPSKLGKQSSLTGSGDGFKLASFETGGFGDGGGDRMFDMLGLGLSAIIEKLSDILDTLTAMALKSGADLRSVGRGGANLGGGNMDVPDLAGMTDEERNTLGLIRQYESHGQNVMNEVGRRMGVGPTQATGYTAQGYYQMLNSNWAHIAPLYGITAPNAMAATDAEQTQVALHLLRHGGIGNWANYNPALRGALARGERAFGVPSPSGMSAGTALHHMPLGADGGRAGGGRRSRRSAGETEALSVHNETTIQVYAPNPGSAAHQVADAQGRIHEQHIRYAQGALLA